METSTEGLVKRWTDAEARVRRLREQLSAADLEERRAADTLGKRIAPEDVVVGEPIACWVRIDRKTERLVVVIKRPKLVEDKDHPYEVRWRSSEREEIT